MNLFVKPAIFSLFLLFFKTNAFIYTKNGVELKYKVNFKHSCRGENDIIEILPGISLPDCVYECGLRISCKTLSYKQIGNTCKMYSSDTNVNDKSKGNCVEVRATDIEIVKTPCPDCGPSETCVPNKQSCEHTECLSPALVDGHTMGNMKDIGASVQYACDLGYTLNNPQNTEAVCLSNGSWSVRDVNCTITVPNVAEGKQTEMSSIHDNNDGSKGVDGNTNQVFAGGSCFHTSSIPFPSWWRVDLADINEIVTVVLYNRLPIGSARATNVKLFVGKTLQTMEVVAHVPGQIDDIHTFRFIDGVLGRFVQVEVYGSKILHLCEVQVFAVPMPNIAEGKVTSMSSLYGHWYKENGVDGNTDQYGSDKTCFHTNITHQHPWWQVDLGKIYDVYKVVLYNRLDYTTATRARDLGLLAGTTLGSLVEYGRVPTQIDDIQTFDFPDAIKARFVRVVLYGYNILHLCEVQVFGYP